MKKIETLPMHLMRKHCLAQIPGGEENMPLEARGGLGRIEVEIDWSKANPPPLRRFPYPCGPDANFLSAMTCGKLLSVWPRERGAPAEAEYKGVTR